MVVVFGKSGLGKSSLLSAGVSQRLRDQGRLPLIVRVNDIQRGPFVSVLEGIQVAAERQKVEYVPGKQESLWGFFKTVEFWQSDLLLTPVLILDQFEELFTLHDRDARTAFITDLGYLVRGVRPSVHAADAKLSDTPPSLNIVLSLREDYLGFLDDAADRIPEILDHRFRLTPLSIEAATEAMTGPARIDDQSFQTKPFTYDPEAITAILNYLSKRRIKSVAENEAYIEPFHLQLICQRIEAIAAKQQQESRADLPITINSIGGDSALKRTLEEFYAQTLAAFPKKSVRQAVRRLCEDLLISPEGRRLSVEGHQIRRQLNLSAETLQQLVNVRLLRSDSRSDSTYYELSHDALVEPVLVTSRMRALLFGWLTVVAGSILAIALGSSELLGIIYGLEIMTGSEKADVPTTVFVVFLLVCFLVLALILMAIVLRNVRAIQRFRWRVLSAPVEPQQTIGRQRDLALGRFAVGAGSICFAWAGLLAFGILLGWRERGAAENLEVSLFEFASIPVFVLLGLTGIRWGLEALDRYNGSPVKHFKVLGTRPLLRIAAGLVAVFAAVLWGGGLLYLVAANYATKGMSPTWVPPRYHALWQSAFEQGVTGINTKIAIGDTASQVGGVTGLLFLGLLLLLRGARTPRRIAVSISVVLAVFIFGWVGLYQGGKWSLPWMRSVTAMPTVKELLNKEEVSTSDGLRSKADTSSATQTTVAESAAQTTVADEPYADLVTVCDWLAASPVDERRPKAVPGVLPEQINVAPALAACNEAVSKYPDIARFSFELGRVLQASKDYSAAREQYERSASLGNSIAMNNIGYFYEKGLDVTQDYAEAKRWYEKAAAAGFPLAMNNIGYFYDKGLGVTQDYAEAKRWYEKAAAGGNSTAMNSIGYLYGNGLGVTQDYAEAKRWYEKAAAAGFPLAMYNVGYLYGNGLGVTQDYAEAKRWYEKAAAGGNSNAMNNIGYLYGNGRGVTLDYAEAKRWYEKAAAAGFPLAMYNIGYFYDKGLGITQDYAEAKRWYEKAAAAGHSGAMVSLGDIYRFGRGVTKSVADARTWYQKAVAAGSPDAQDRLDALGSR
jgi:TPR repeat protein